MLKTPVDKGPGNRLIEKQKHGRLFNRGHDHHERLQVHKIELRQKYARELSKSGRADNGNNCDGRRSAKLKRTTPSATGFSFPQ